jgi:hypothetical protein
MRSLTKNRHRRHSPNSGHPPIIKFGTVSPNMLFRAFIRVHLNLGAKREKIGKNLLTRFPNEKDARATATRAGTKE